MSLRARFYERKDYFFVSAAVFAADQASKIAADTWLRYRPPVEVVPGFFNLAYSRNRGGLFGYFATLDDPWRWGLLTIFPALAIVMISVFLAKTQEPDRATLLGLALILGGATGNLLDRVVRGEVVDFLDAYASWAPLETWLVEKLGTAHWPTFNLADSAIVTGALLLFLDVLRPSRQAEAGRRG